LQKPSLIFVLPINEAIYILPAITYKFGIPTSFSSTEKEQFCNMLVKQGKVRNPSVEKLNNCKAICICIGDDEIISIGAIKPKTAIDFSKAKANLPHLSKSFTWELGYCYTDPKHTGNGYSSTIVKQLVESYQGNLMATTELREDNSMLHILERFGFKQLGQTWKSTIHDGTLALFLLLFKKS